MRWGCVRSRRLQAAVPNGHSAIGTMTRMRPATRRRRPPRPSRAPGSATWRPSRDASAPATVRRNRCRAPEPTPHAPGGAGRARAGPRSRRWRGHTPTRGHPWARSRRSPSGPGTRSERPVRRIARPRPPGACAGSRSANRSRWVRRGVGGRVELLVRALVDRSSGTNDFRALGPRGLVVHLRGRIVPISFVPKQSADTYARRR